MALALLGLLGIDGSSARFRIDTGTNRFYQLRLGRERTRRSELDWLDGVVQRTPLAVNPRGGQLLDSATEIAVPVPPRVPGQPLYAQLLSFKTREGRSPGISPVVALERGMTMPPIDYSSPESCEERDVMDDGSPAFNRPRAVACRTCAEQFSGPSIDELLAQVARVAGPLVLQLLGQASPPAGAAPAAGAAPIAGLLQTLLGALPGLLHQGTATQQSLLRAPPNGDNRFDGRAGEELAHPFIFGIDDAVFGALIGQVAQVLPQLANAANQRRLQEQQGRNQLVTDLVGQVERRMLLQQVLDAQRQAPAGQTADLAQLAALLQQAGAGDGAGTAAAPPAAPAAPAAAAPAAAHPASLAMAAAVEPGLSARAVAAFVTAAPIRFNGADRVLFARGRPIALQVKLAVADPAPATPLPKAIIRVAVKRAGEDAVLAEKVVKRRDLPANGVVTVPFSAEELAHVPAGVPVSLLAEIRWRAGEHERKALGALETAFIDRWFVKERGAATGEERELTDMSRFRSFWNKVWESPVLDGAGPDKRFWKVDADLRYSVLLDGDHPSNGLMETRFLAAEQDRDSVGARAEGRMKGGIDLSVDELAKLATLWPGEAILDADHVAAFRTPDVARGAAGEVVRRVKLDGRREDRGLVWVVPVLQLVDHTLGTVQATNDAGQVTAAGEEHARLPLPTAVRILGLKSGAETGAAPEPDGDGAQAPAYRFDGYHVALDDKVALTPHG